MCTDTPELRHQVSTVNKRAKACRPDSDFRSFSASFVSAAYLTASPDCIPRFHKREQSKSVSWSSEGPSDSQLVWRRRTSDEDAELSLVPLWCETKTVQTSRRVGWFVRQNYLEQAAQRTSLKLVFILRRWCFNVCQCRRVAKETEALIWLVRISQTLDKPSQTERGILMNV